MENGKKRNRPRTFLLPELVLAGIGLFTIILWGVIGVTNSSLFCGATCHLMVPFYEVWKSSHHNQVSCVSCHNGEDRGPVARRAPGLYQVAGYFSPSSGSKMAIQFSDRSCLGKGCHDSRLLAGGVVVKWSRVPFDHQPHLQNSRKGILLRCTSCHAREVMGLSTAADREPCFLCHRSGPSGGGGDHDCVLCHPAGSLSPGPASLHRLSAQGETPSCRRCHPIQPGWNGEADQRRCGVCHQGSLSRAIPANTDELHRFHVTLRQFKCAQCHAKTIHHAGTRRSM